MADSLRLASKGYSKSRGGLNLNELKRELININPDDVEEINRMKRPELEGLAREYFRSIAPSHVLGKDRPKILLTPDEVLIEYLLPLNPQSLQAACRTSRDFARICDDEYFWQRKVKYDFGEDTKQLFGSWKKTYKDFVMFKDKTYEVDLEVYPLIYERPPDGGMVGPIEEIEISEENLKIIKDYFDNLEKVDNPYLEDYILEFDTYSSTLQIYAKAKIKVIACPKLASIISNITGSPNIQITQDDRTYLVSLDIHHIDTTEHLYDQLYEFIIPYLGRAGERKLTTWQKRDLSSFLKEEISKRFGYIIDNIDVDIIDHTLGKMAVKVLVGFFHMEGKFYPSRSEVRDLVQNKIRESRLIRKEKLYEY